MLRPARARHQTRTGLGPYLNRIGFHIMKAQIIVSNLVLYVIAKQKSRPVCNPWPKYLDDSIRENQCSVAPTQLHLSCLEAAVRHSWHKTLAMAVEQILVHLIAFAMAIFN